MSRNLIGKKKSVEQKKLTKIIEQKVTENHIEAENSCSKKKKKKETKYSYCNRVLYQTKKKKVKFKV